MNPTTSQKTEVGKLITAFETDHFNVDEQNGIFQYNGKTGITATHQTATIGSTGRKKKAFYVEGSPQEMGYLLGMMAEPDIEQMTTTFNDTIIFSFLNVTIKDKFLRELLGKLLVDIIDWLSQEMKKDIPQSYTDEITGMLQGCKQANANTNVTEKGLWVLNVGIDAILSVVYTGQLPSGLPFDQELKADYFKIPIMCNAFSIFGESVEKSGHLFGRDFMFPTADVFQNVACLVIQKPDQGNLMVNATAPGMLGSIAGLNVNGVGVGVDMSAGGNCNPDRAGFNSLLLTRYSIEKGATIDDALEIIINAQRGVSWNYILADGSKQKAYIIEAGMKTENLDPLQYPLEALKTLLPDQEFIDTHQSVPDQKGVMVRSQGYHYPVDYFGFNQGLVEECGKIDPEYHYDYCAGDFEDAKGYIDKTWTDGNCPWGYYFAPQREALATMVLTTNHYIVPEMRLCAMKLWTNLVASGNINDIQWRYDELNNQLLSQLEKSPLSYDQTRSIIDFLAPYGKFPDYYNAEKKPLDQVQIHGVVSLLDLKARTIESHYGYYSDDWIKITLINYN